jgi:hypothetical protein
VSKTYFAEIGRAAAFEARYGVGGGYVELLASRDDGVAAPGKGLL